MIARWLVIAAILVVIFAMLAYEFWPRIDPPNRCDCGHRRTTHNDDGSGCCLRSDCDCREFQQA